MSEEIPFSDYLKKSIELYRQKMPDVELCAIVNILNLAKALGHELKPPTDRFGISYIDDIMGVSRVYYSSVVPHETIYVTSAAEGERMYRERM